MGACSSKEDKPQQKQEQPQKGQEQAAPAEEEERDIVVEEEENDWTRGLLISAAPPADGENSRDLPFETQRTTPDWDALRKKLPYGRTDEEHARRKEMFNAMDINSNNYLSLAEVDKGIRDVLECDELFNAKAPIARAFNLAKDLAPAYTAHSDDYVTRKEFRVLLLNLGRMFEIFTAFKEIDTEADNRLTLEEFEKAVPMMKEWGCRISDPARVFRSIDRNNGGKILFGEFVTFVQKNKLKSDYME